MAETRKVQFEDGETRDVPITDWLPAQRSREISENPKYLPREPNWRRVLPDYEVTPVIGGYVARRR